MGTRHLTAVYLDGEYKVAQYGQFDGYPRGGGRHCLKFARRIADENERKKFADKVRQCKLTASRKLWNMSNAPEYRIETGYEILDVIMDSDRKFRLINDIDFAANSLLCEWAWVIDLDANTFEAFKGLNRDREVQPEDRFYFLRDSEEVSTQCEDNFHCVYPVAKWSLDDLPTDEEFLATFKGGNING